MIYIETFNSNFMLLLLFYFYYIKEVNCTKKRKQLGDQLCFKKFQNEFVLRFPNFDKPK